MKPWSQPRTDAGNEALGRAGFEEGKVRHAVSTDLSGPIQVYPGLIRVSLIPSATIAASWTTRIAGMIFTKVSAVSHCRSEKVCGNAQRLDLIR